MNSFQLPYLTPWAQDVGHKKTHLAKGKWHDYAAKKNTRALAKAV